MDLAAGGTLTSRVLAISADEDVRYWILSFLIAFSRLINFLLHLKPDAKPIRYECIQGLDSPTLQNNGHLMMCAIFYLVDSKVFLDLNSILRIWYIKRILECIYILKNSLKDMNIETRINIKRLNMIEQRKNAINAMFNINSE